MGYGQNDSNIEKYTDIAINAYHAIQESITSDYVKEDITTLYGIYYSALVSLIRIGIPCERIAGVDGLPLLKLKINGTDYTCPEQAACGIGGPELDRYLQLGKDSFCSYLTLPQGSTTLSDSDAQQFELCKKELEQLRNQILTKDSATQRELIATQAELKAIRESKDFLEKQYVGSSTKDMYSEIQQKLLQATEELSEFKLLYEKLKQQKEATEQEIRRLEQSLQEEIEKKKEEPAEYAYYYKEVLPKLLSYFEASGIGLGIKFLLILISCGLIGVAVWIICLL